MIIDQGDKIKLYWPKELLFKSIAVQSMYNARSAEDFDLLAFTEDEWPFFEQHIGKSFADLTGYFRRIMCDTDAVINNDSEIGLAFTYNADYGDTHHSRADLFGLGEIAEKFMVSSMLEKWYRTIPAADSLAKENAAEMGNLDAQMKNVLFRFYRPTGYRSSYNIIQP